MIGTSLEQAEELGVSDLGTALGLDDDEDGGGRDGGNGWPRAVEMGAVGPAGGGGGGGRAAPFGAAAPSRPGTGKGPAGGPQQQQRGAGGGGGQQLPLSSSGADLAIPPPHLPPVRTRVPEPPRFSLGDDEALSPMDEIRLHGSPPRKVAQD
jgi:hypothetical protein